MSAWTCDLGYLIALAAIVMSLAAWYGSRRR